MDNNKLQKQFDFMEAHEDCSFCFHPNKVVDVRDGETLSIVGRRNDGDVLPEDVFLFGGARVVPTNSIFCQSKYLKEFPKFMLLSKSGDIFLVLYLSACGRVGYIDDVMSVRHYGVKGSFNDRYRNEYDVEKVVQHQRSIIEGLVACRRQVISYINC